MGAGFVFFMRIVRNHCVCVLLLFNFGYICFNRFGAFVVYNTRMLLSDIQLCVSYSSFFCLEI